MTFEDFKLATRRKNSFDKYWHYFVAISFGLFSIFGIFYISFVDEGRFRSVGYMLYPALFLILGMSLSAFYLLPIRYKVVVIDSPLTLDSKRTLADSFLLEHCGMSGNVRDNYFFGSLKRKWWQSRYMLHFYFDESRFAFSLQGHDHDGGWIDFGQTERKRKLLKSAIITLSSQ